MATFMQHDCMTLDRNGTKMYRSPNLLISPPKVFAVFCNEACSEALQRNSHGVLQTVSFLCVEEAAVIIGDIIRKGTLDFILGSTMKHFSPSGSGQQFSSPPCFFLHRIVTLSS